MQRAIVPLRIMPLSQRVSLPWLLLAASARRVDYAVSTSMHECVARKRLGRSQRKAGLKAGLRRGRARGWAWGRARPAHATPDDLVWFPVWLNFAQALRPCGRVLAASRGRH